MADEDARGARTLEDMLGAGGRLSDDLRGIAAQLACSERTRAQFADDLMLVALDADFLEAEAARLRGLIDAVREGCAPAVGGYSFGKPFRATLDCNREGKKVLRDALYPEEGETDGREDK